MSTLVDLLCEPTSWSDRDALVSAIAADLDVPTAVALRIAANLADREEALDRRHQASEAVDDIAQGLAAALYALELDDRPRVEHYLRRTLNVASGLLSDLVDSGCDNAFRRSRSSDLADRRAV